MPLIWSSDAMTPKYTIAKVLADGCTAWYWNPPSAARRDGLVAEALGCDRRAAMARAAVLNAQWDDLRSRTGGRPHGTVAWGIARYLKGGRFGELQPSSQRTYLQAIRHIEAVFGPHPAEAVRVRHAQAFYERLRRPRPGSERPRLGLANGVLRVARLLWDSFAGDEIVTANPFLEVKMRGLASRETCWTRAQVEAFVANADDMGESGIATAVLLAFELCQRQGDILSLTWAQLAGSFVRLRQSKTRAKVIAELPPYLCERLAKLRKERAEVVLQPDGEPWRKSMNVFRRRFRAIAEVAALPKTLTFMDLRRSGITEMAEAGATDNEILAVSGHKTREMLKIYARTTGAQATHGLEKRWRFAVVDGPSQAA